MSIFRVFAVLLESYFYKFLGKQVDRQVKEKEKKEVKILSILN